MRKKTYRLSALSLALIMAMGDCCTVFASEPEAFIKETEEDSENNSTDNNTVTQNDGDTSEQSDNVGDDSGTQDGKTDTDESTDSGESSGDNSDADTNGDLDQDGSESVEEDEESTGKEGTSDNSDADENNTDTTDNSTEDESKIDNIESSDEQEADEAVNDEKEEDSSSNDEGEETTEKTEEDSKDPQRVVSNILEEKLNEPVLGSDGIEHEGIEYITYRAFLTLDNESKDEYIKMCDEAVDILNLGYGIDDVVISTDNEGELTMGFFVNFEELSEATYEQGENESEEETTDEEDCEETVDDEATADTDLEELNSEIIEISDVDELNEEEKADLGLLTPQAENEDKLDDVLVEEENVEIPADEPLDIVIDLSEDLDDPTVNTFDSSLSVYNQNYFYNQLTSGEKDVFNYGKSSLLGGRNSFSFSHSYIDTSSICNSLSALMTTYSSSFGWVDKSSNGGFSVSRSGCGSSVCSYTVTVQKSAYYSAALASQASSKINEIVKEAYSYAKTNYPDKPTFGMVCYFDEWLCAHNYYNYDGVASYGGNRNSATYYYCHSPYGCLLKGYGVCESYALAMSALLDKAGIPNIYVVGWAGGGHAWNYIYMPNKKWYLQDSTWNDSTSQSQTYSTKNYLLVKKDSRTADGQFYCSGRAFSFPALSTGDYTYTYYENGRKKATPLYDEPLNISRTSLILKPKDTKKLSINKYYTNYKKTWSSSNTAVARVSSTGKVVAVSSGVADISCTLGGRTETCKVYVYNISSLRFDNNKKTKTITFKNEDTILDSADVQTFSVNVRQSNAWTTAANLKSLLGLAGPKVSNSNKKIATVSNVRLVDDTIYFDVQPLKLGSTKLTVKFAGKTAVLTLKVKQVLQDDWFYLQYTEKNYKKGKALKPKVKKNNAPKKVAYTVSYRNNKKPGTATVLIKGKGNYIGTITKEFTITDY